FPRIKLTAQGAAAVEERDEESPTITCHAPRLPQRPARVGHETQAGEERDICDALVVEWEILGVARLHCHSPAAGAGSHARRRLKPVVDRQWASEATSAHADLEPVTADLTPHRIQELVNGRQLRPVQFVVRLIPGVVVLDTL